MEATMRKVLGVGLLMLCLSFPVQAGHTVAGGHYCDPCNNLDCICDGTGQQSTPMKNPAQNAPAEIGSGVLLGLAFLIMLLRYRN